MFALSLYFASCFYLRERCAIFYITFVSWVLFAASFYLLLIWRFNCIQNILFLNSDFDLDSVSILLITLIFIIFPACLIYNFAKIFFSFWVYSILLTCLYYLLILSFSVNNFFFFYILFEGLLLPMSLIISVWGSRGRKLHATFLFFFYTFISSIFIFLGLFMLIYDFGSISFIVLKFSFVSSLKLQLFILIFFFLGFIAKIPSFPVHIWLPEAHVEAPTVGSVILASILLKLGYYALFRTLLYISTSECFLYIKPLFELIFLISMIYGACSAICQIDLKKIVAYSSIVHMNFAMLGFISFTYGLYGSLFLMFSHGLISAALFFMVGFLYDRFFTRNIIYYGGLVQYLPIFSIFYFAFIFSNMSLPGTCNFVGELLVFFSLINFTLTLVFCAAITTFLVSIFCLILLNRVIFCQISGFFKFNLYDLTILEFFLILPLFVFIYLFGLFPTSLMNLAFLMKF